MPADIFRRKKIIRNIASLFVCFVSMAAVTFAWFYNAQNSSAEALEFVSISSAELEISLDGENWQTGLNVPFPENLEFVPVSGSGTENRMYLPELLPGSSSPEDAVSWKSTVYDPDAAENSYYYFPVYFRADCPGYVELSEIDIEPAAAPEERQNKSYTDKSGKEIDGAAEVVRPIEDSLLYTLIPGGRIITKDYIAGAARVGLVNRTDSGDSDALSNALIIANDTYALSFAVTDGEGSCTLNECAPSVSGGSYYNGSAAVSYSGSGLNVFTESSIRGGNAVRILELKQTEGGYYEGQIDVCLWIEGFDNEAVEILSGGRLTAEMTYSFASAGQ